ncbi:alpha/beta hydrolase [Mariniflexile sp. HMF6888]|uniref:alpha/beta hydrolase n=1 Tax=Mariniflexile sp. HMF6888 TaxID=3373086 RepID=UPI0037B98E4D
MQKNIKTVVITPEKDSSTGMLPVVYLLHGANGNYSDWIKKVEGIKEYADSFNIIIVCPDGGSTSWYFDSPIDTSSKYETFISAELVNAIDSKYNTIRDRNGRAIVGLSMGGHGALYLAFRHQDIYSAVGSMSGGVDIRPFPNSWDIEKRLGSYSKFTENWERNTVINMLYLLKPNALEIILDCGTEDFFFEVNKNLHQQLLYRNIPHDFIVRPGGHDWAYWSNSIKFQLLYMAIHFKR